MAILTGPEMCALCGITMKNLSTYKGRKKVVGKKDPKKSALMYDTTTPINVEFISVRKTFMQLNGRPTGIPSPEEIKKASKDRKPIAQMRTATNKERKIRTKREAKSKAVKVETDPLDVVIEEMAARYAPGKSKGSRSNVSKKSEDKLVAEAIGIFSLDQQKKALEVEKLAEQVEIERMKKEKMQGEVIPSDLVRLLFAQHFKNMSLKFKEEAEKITGVMVLQLGGKKSDKLEILKRLEDSVNTAINEAEELTSFDLDGIIDEYSNKRGKGERK